PSLLTLKIITVKIAVNPLIHLTSLRYAGDQLVIHLSKNMAELKYLNELLSAAAGILDSAAAEIRDIPLNPTKENISTIGKALTLIIDIQLQIYQIDPKLKPEYLKRSSPYPAEINRRYGDIVIKDADLCDLKMYQEAISLYEGFISENPPEFFTNMARNRISKIKKDYSV
ncbi:hypothetical protein D1BOALGB6SA_9793, partial [Olavius sp. associated proteobacterium Delta 1]